MNRKQVIEHFRELAEMAGKPLKTNMSSQRPRLICAGHSVILPPRQRKIRRIGAIGHKLGLSASKLTCP